MEDKREKGTKRDNEGNPKTDSPSDVDMGNGGGSISLMSARASAGGRTDGSETHVDPIAEVKLRPFHNTQDTLMIFHTTGRSLSVAATDDVNGVASFAIRLNSIEDCQTITTYAADPTPAADTADGSVQRPMMYDYWTGAYRYWTVTKSEYEVKLWTTLKSDSSALSVWCYHNGQQQPPLINSSGGTICKDYVRQLHQHCRMQVMHPRPSGSTDLHERSTTVTFKGEYRPGNRTVVNDVSEDEYKETWHRVGEVPSLREVATFIIQHNDDAEKVAHGTICYSITVKYHVQWKDLKVIYQYPTQTSDIAAIADYVEEDI